MERLKMALININTTGTNSSINDKKGNALIDLIISGAIVINDNIVGSYDDDILYGYAGNDTINGSWGKDIIYGGSDDDILRGGDGRSGPR